MLKISRERYLYTLQHDIMFITSNDFGDELTLLKDDFGKIIASVRNHKVIVERGYSWDGCSPKWKVTLLGKTFLLGTPDGRCVVHKNKVMVDIAPMRKYASLLHDVLCQFHVKLEGKITSDQIHKEFRTQLVKVDDPLSNLFHRSVRFYWNHVKKMLG